MNLEIVHRGAKPLGSRPGGRLELVHSHEHAGHAKLTGKMVRDLGSPFTGARFRAHPLWIPTIYGPAQDLNMSMLKDPDMRTDEIHVEEHRVGGKTLAVLRGLCDCGKAKNR